MKNVARRRYITALAASGVGILAGCASDESSSNTSQPQQNQKNDSNGNTESQNSNPDENTEAQNDESTENAKATKKGSATVRSADFILGDSVTAPPSGQIPWAVTEIKNIEGITHGRVQTELRFYDSNDTILEVREGYCPYIPANTVWKDYTRYYTKTPDRLEYVEARIIKSDLIVDASEIEAATVVSSDMTTDPEGGIDLTAEIDLQGANPDTVTIVGLFYDVQGRFRGAISSFKRNPAATVAMSAGTISIRTPPNLQGQQVDSHKIVVLDGFI